MLNVNTTKITIVADDLINVDKATYSLDQLQIVTFGKQSKASAGLSKVPAS